MRDKYKRMVMGCLLFISCLLSAGCWDRREIQDRSFVLGAAVDTADTKNFSDPTETFARGRPGRPYRFSLQVQKIVGKEGGGSGGGSGAESNTYLLSNLGNTSFEAIRDLSGKNSKPLWFEHLQAIVLSEEAVKQAGLSRVLDFFWRDSEMRSGTRVFISPGEAKAVLEFKAPTGEAGGIFLARAMQLQAKNPELVSARVNLGYLSASNANNSDVVIPRVLVFDKDVRVTGAAAFKGDKFIGYIDEYTVKGARIILGLEKSALITYECPEHPGEYWTFELFRHDTVYLPHVEGDNIYFTLETAMRGNLAEVSCKDLHNLNDTKLIKTAEHLFEQEVERNVEHSASTFKRMGIDILEFKKRLKASYPEKFESTKDRWDEVYPTIPIYTNVRISIVTLGARG